MPHKKNKRQMVVGEKKVGVVEIMVESPMNDFASLQYLRLGRECVAKMGVSCVVDGSHIGECNWWVLSGMCG